MRWGEALRVQWQSGPTPSSARGSGKNIDVPFAGEEELQEAKSLASASLEDAEEHQVIFQSGFFQDPRAILAVVRNCLIAFSALLLFHGTPSYWIKVKSMS